MARDVNLAFLATEVDYTATGLVGAAITTEGGFRADVRVKMGTITGTTPTCDLKVDASIDGGSSYKNIADFPRLIGTDDLVEIARPVVIPRADVAGGYNTVKVRVYATIGGSSPHFPITWAFLEPLLSLAIPTVDSEQRIGLCKFLDEA